MLYIQANALFSSRCLILKQMPYIQALMTTTQVVTKSHPLILWYKNTILSYKNLLTFKFFLVASLILYAPLKMEENRKRKSFSLKMLFLYVQLKTFCYEKSFFICDDEHHWSLAGGGLQLKENKLFKTAFN